MIDIQIDAAAKGNPGISGAGIVIRSDEGITEYSIPLGVYTNHEAEFLALLKALEICKKQFPNEILAVQTDSQIVVQAVENNYVKNPVFQPLLEKIVTIKEQFPLFFIKWIPNKQNKHADQLARAAIRKQLKNDKC